MVIPAEATAHQLGFARSLCLEMECVVKMTCLFLLSLYGNSKLYSKFHPL